MMRPVSVSLKPKTNPLIGITAMLLAIAMTAAQALAQAAPPPGQVAAGRADFVANCADCHGKDGKGNGPSTNVIPRMKPADLTKIAARNGGVFPAAQVADTIYGRQQIPSHTRFNMPFWGLTFQESGKEFTPESEAKAKARIDAIVAYIKTLQVK